MADDFESEYGKRFRPIATSPENKGFSGNPKPGVISSSGGAGSAIRVGVPRRPPAMSGAMPQERPSDRYYDSSQDNLRGMNTPDVKSPSEIGRSLDNRNYGGAAAYSGAGSPAQPQKENDADAAANKKSGNTFMFVLKFGFIFLIIYLLNLIGEFAGKEFFNTPYLGLLLAVVFAVAIFFIGALVNRRSKPGSFVINVLMNMYDGFWEIADKVAWLWQRRKKAHGQEEATTPAYKPPMQP